MFRPFHKYMKFPINHLTNKSGPLTVIVTGQARCQPRFYVAGDKKGYGNPAKEGSFSNLMKNTLPESRKVKAETEGPRDFTQGSGSNSSGDGKKKRYVVLFLVPLAAAALLYKLWDTFSTQYKGDIGNLIDKDKGKRRKERISQKYPPTSEDIPSQVPYLLIGGGTASFAAFRAIKSNDPTAQILVISEEPYYPYMRPPLSKEMFYDEDRNSVRSFKFRQWNGKPRSLFYEPDEFYTEINSLMSAKNGGIAVARGWSVDKLDLQNHKAYLNDGKEISYRKCLIATGAKPKNLPVFENATDKIKEKVMLYRNIYDFEELEDIMNKGAKSLAIVGGGFLGSELACALARRGKAVGLTVHQIFREDGNMDKVLPSYLSKWTTKKVEKEGVNVIKNAEVISVDMKEGRVLLKLNNDQEVEVDQVIVSVGVAPNTHLAETSGLEVDPEVGGFLVNAEMEARSNLYIAGDCACFYDVKLGRRRVEHHDNAVVSGRLAGENMTGAGKPYTHQSMLWSDLGPEVGYEAIGIVDSSLPTFGVYAKSEEKDEEAKPDSEEDYVKGVVFYLKNDIVVGILLWNIFSRIGVARQILKEGKKFEDLSEVAKFFEIYSD